MLNQIMQSCNYLLYNYPGAAHILEYLNHRVSCETQQVFQFGFFPSASELHILTELVGKETLQQEGLLYSRGIMEISYFEHHPLIIAFRDAYGKVMGLVGRTLFSSQDMKTNGIAKYKNTEFKKGNNLFGLFENKNYILEKQSAYLVEGQFDAMKMVERGFKNVVALGNNNITDYQFSIINRYTNNLFLLLDNDEAGEKGRKNTIKKFGLLATINNCYISEQYKDIDEYLDAVPMGEELGWVVKDV